MEYKTNIAFLGGLFPNGHEDEIYQNSIGLYEAGSNSLQWNIVEGLDAINHKQVKIINSLFIGAYPFKYKKFVVKTYRFKHCHNADDINVGYINLYALKQIFRFLSLKSHLKKWAKEPSKNKVIIAYALTSPFVKSLIFLKKIDPTIKTCIVVPDLPQYMNRTGNGFSIHRGLKKIDMHFIYKNLKHIDYFVLLTEHMKEALRLGHNKYVVVEGIATDVFFNMKFNKMDDGIIRILYTGKLIETNGIINLLEAFKRINNENYRLNICGSGEAEKYVIDAAQLDKRIVYMGQVNHKDILKLQRDATVLVNPRQNSGEYTRYSFPSKNLEYLSSGTPVIAYKLDGIPNEYDEHIFYVADNKVEALQAKILEVCNMSSYVLKQHGEKAKRFVLEEKNKYKQAQKIMELLNC